MGGRARPPGRAASPITIPGMCPGAGVDVAISDQLHAVITDQGEKATSRAKRANSQTGAATEDAAAGLAVSGPESESQPTVSTFVIDTSVLLSDPRALLRFAEHEVVLPIVVITELEGKRHHPELGYFARSALRTLDELRIKAGRLDAPVPVGEDGGTLRVELNHTDPSALPAGFRLGDNDTRILSVAKNLSNEG